MQTDALEQGLTELLELDREAGPVAIMCSEAVPWRCHRSTAADALVARGVPVAQILGAGPMRHHQLNPMARIEGTSVNYPAETIPRDHAKPRK
jgi:uncharacterized protein (DUF488 family)